MSTNIDRRPTRQTYRIFTTGKDSHRFGMVEAETPREAQEKLTHLRSRGLCVTVDRAVWLLRDRTRRDGLRRNDRRARAVRS